MKKESLFDTLNLIKGYCVIPLIFLLCFNSPFITGNAILSDKQICFQVYSFIESHQGKYNVFDVKGLDNSLNMSVEPYLNNFYGKCIGTGYITNLQISKIQNSKGCNLTLSGFFGASIPIPTDIYFSDLSCDSEKMFNNIFLMEDGKATGIRFWFIALTIILLWGVVELILFIRRKSKAIKTS